MELFRTLKAISGWDGTDVSQTVTPPRAPSGANNIRYTLMLISESIDNRYVDLEVDSKTFMIVFVDE